MLWSKRTINVLTELLFPCLETVATTDRYGSPIENAYDDCRAILGVRIFDWSDAPHPQEFVLVSSCTITAQYQS